MSEAQSTTERDCRRPRSARRQAAAVVAQYIHELGHQQGEPERADAVMAAGRAACGFTKLLHLSCGAGGMTSFADLLRGSDREYFDLFERAGANIVRAAELLDDMLAGFPESQGLAREILICEQDGDQITHEVIRRLNQTFVTPIDREDILELTSALDDIVDYTEEVADYLGLYKVEAPMIQAQRLARVLARRHSADRIGDPADSRLQGHRRPHRGGASPGERWRSNRARGDRVAVRGGIDPMVVIRWKDIFERLENAIDSTERAADILEGIVIKNA